MFLSRWKLDTIRVRFSFFTEHEVTSLCLRSNGSFMPGVLSTFKNPFVYNHKNTNNDIRFSEHLEKPLYVQVMDSSAQMTIAYGFINLPSITFDSISNTKFYEITLFTPDDI